MLINASSKLTTTVDLAFIRRIKIGARTRAKPNPDTPLTKAATKTAQNARIQDILKISRLCIRFESGRYKE